jgi:hypothetical protein
MMLDATSTWKSTIDGLPAVSDDSWRENLSAAIHSLVSGKLEVATLSASTFTFGRAAFKAALSLCVPASTAVAGATNFANAWASGIEASAWAVSVGAYIGTTAPATMYGPVSTAGTPSPPIAATDPASITSAKAALVSALTSAGPADDSEAFAAAFRDAFLGLKINVNGFNSIPYNPPTTVPAPLAVVSGPAK